MTLNVEKKFIDQGIRYRIIPLDRAVFNVQDAVNAASYVLNKEEICKTLILKGKKTNNKYAVLLPWNDKIDFLKTKTLLGEAVTFAEPEEVKEVANAEPGAVCPFLLQVPLTVDRKVLDLARIHCGSGNPLYGLEIDRADLSKMVNFEVADIAHSA